MPYVVISRYTRTDPSTKWHTEIDFDQTIVDTYLDMIRSEFVEHRIRTIAETDPNTLEVEIVWESQEIFEDFFSRPETVAIIAEIAKYNESVNITAHPKEKFEI